MILEYKYNLKYINTFIGTQYYNMKQKIVIRRIGVHTNSVEPSKPALQWFVELYLFSQVKKQISQGVKIKFCKKCQKYTFSVKNSKIKIQFGYKDEQKSRFS